MNASINVPEAGGTKVEASRRGLQSLPIELLAEICSYFCAHCARNRRGDTWPFDGKHDHGGSFGGPIEVGSRTAGGSVILLNMSRVNKTLHAVAGEYLCHRASLRGPALWCLLNNSWDQPHRAPRIREVEVAYVDIFLSPGDLPRPPPYPCRQYAPRLAFQNLLVAVLQLPSPTLTSLRRLAFSSSPSSHNRLDYTIPLLATAPNLEVLHFYDCGSFHTQPQPLQNLTELKLANTCLSLRDLDILLPPVGPRLCKFNLGQTANTAYRAPGVGFDELIRVLAPWKTTLKELSYTTGERRVLTGPDFRGLSLLRCLDSLEMLCTEACFFYDRPHFTPSEVLNLFASTLPSSICEVKLRGYHHTLNPALRGLLAKVEAGRFRRLRIIDVDADTFDPFRFDYSEVHIAPSWVQSELEAIRASFQAVGVDFVTLNIEYRGDLGY
ncbi:uncharacterized protein B0H64DRAFT_354360 [Chaetomium fimeti]|uniref:Uncharacterized protein n=1 Tax=Chaetomium fimeti TaxID=1854472 RepID=A0AAE0LV68_9PEZI|nr:hypothetical protein B0H64DRAFT_354360 [Chaetomium fimeti]